MLLFAAALTEQPLAALIKVHVLDVRCHVVSKDRGQRLHLGVFGR